MKKGRMKKITANEEVAPDVEKVQFLLFIYVKFATNVIKSNLREFRDVRNSFPIWFP